MPSNSVLEELRELVNDFKGTIPVVTALRNKNLLSYHWEEIRSVINKQFTLNDTFTLQDLFELGVNE